MAIPGSDNPFPSVRLVDQSVAPTPPPINLLANPSFETGDLTSWAVVNAGTTGTAVTGPAATHGDWFARLTNTSGSAILEQAGITAASGDVFSAGVDVIATNTTALLRVLAYDGAGAFLSTVASTSTATPGRLTVTSTACPANTATVRVGVHLSTVGEVDVDAVQLERGAAVSPFTPGTGSKRLFSKADGLYTLDAAGVEVGPLGTGGGGGRALIDEVVLAADGTISFSSIPATFTDLLIVASLRGTTSGPAGTIRVGSSGVASGAAAYIWHEVVTGSLGTITAQSSGDTMARFGRIASTGTGKFAACKIQIMDYTTTGRPMHIIGESGHQDGVQRLLDNAYAEWVSPAGAVSDISIGDTTHTALRAGSRARLYGLS